MEWNFDFDICAVAMMAVLVLYFLRKHDVPLRRNRIFFACVVSSISVALLDIVASVMSSYHDRFPVWSLYLINMLYYLAKALSPVIFYHYCHALTNKLDKFASIRIITSTIPLAATFVVVLSAPMNHYLFSIGETGFIYGPGRWVLFAEMMIYFALSCGHILMYRKVLKRVSIYSVMLYLLFAFAGHVAQIYFKYSQMSSFGVSIGLMILFISFQNPNYFIDKKTTLFSAEGFIEYYKEQLFLGRKVSVVTLSINEYKSILNLRGAEFIGNILEQFSVFLRVNFKRGTFFYFHNGRIFVIGWDDENLDEAFRLINKRCAEGFSNRWGETHFTMSYIVVPADIGVSNIDELNNLLLVADRDRMNNDGVLIVGQEQLESSRHEYEIERALKRAIMGEGLEVYYQPIYSTEKKKIVSAEALVRIHDDKLGVIYPDDFIWRAERDGSIVKLGEMVFEETCRFISENDLDALGLDYIEINLSPIQCVREKLANEFIEIVNRYGVRPGQINLEITESSTSDYSMVRENMDKLREAGMSLSLDDYGTGYSNLINVLNLPLQIIKIDKSILWAYFREGNEILLQVIKTFRYRDFKIVVEGVEDEKMVRELEELGVEYQQGYYFSKPVPKDKFLTFLKGFKA